MGHTASSTTKVPPNWDATQIPSLKNKIAVVTGANSGIGYVTALELARHGADVVLACRNESKGEEAAKTIRETLSNVDGHGKVDAKQLDVSSLKSVQRFSDEFLLQHDKLDILVNNAGVMAIPYEETVDGYEMQFATNHLGHFALTTRLFDALKHSPSARVVNVSSSGHRGAKMNLNAVMTGSKGYNPITAYSNSKLYNILFTLEFDRRLKSSGITSITSASVHPGISRTNLADAPSTRNSFFYRAGWTLVTWLSWLHVFQGADMGALPSLYASTALEVDGGDFFGPAWSIWGYPALEEPSNESKSEEAATKLWQESERLAKLKFDVK